MKLKTLAVIFFTTVIFSCSSDDDNSNNCEAEDFGYLKINIPKSDTYRTAILLTPVGSSNAQEEIIAKGKTTATFEIDSGTYTMSVDQINEEGEAVGSGLILNVTIEQCETTEQTVSAT